MMPCVEDIDGYFKTKSIKVNGYMGVKECNHKHFLLKEKQMWV